MNPKDLLSFVRQIVGLPVVAGALGPLGGAFALVGLGILDALAEGDDWRAEAGLVHDVVASYRRADAAARDGMRRRWQEHAAEALRRAQGSQAGDTLGIYEEPPKP